MGEIGKSLAFDEDSVQGLLKIRYGDTNCFALLSLIYPFGDASRRHVDHIYPQTAFTRSTLLKAGFTTEQAERRASDAQELANLQLLTPAENESKGGTMPGTWLASAYPVERDRAAVRSLHHLGDVSDDLAAFDGFLVARRMLLAREIRARLGVA